MGTSTTLRRRILYLMVCLAVTAWGIVGIIQRPNQGWGGFVYNLDYTIEVLSRTWDNQHTQAAA